jgi:phage shock protein C
MENKLQRSQDDRMIAGVASGMAEYLNTDPVWIRVGFVLAVFAGLSGILIYIILWIAIPVKPYIHPVDYKVYDDNEGPHGNRARALPAKDQGSGRLIGGLLLIFMGVYFLSEEFNILPYWVSFHRLWPLVLIIPGIMMLTRATKKDHVRHEPEQPIDKKRDYVVEEDTKTPDQSV